MLSTTFIALKKEAEFTKQMLGSGATQIRAANYASQGTYFQAFTSLSTGLERIGKLCLMLDHYIDNNGRFPDSKHLKNQIGHKLHLLYEQSISVIRKRDIKMAFSENLDSPVHQAILTVLSDFAQGDRYSNIDLLSGAETHGNPISSWFTTVDELLYSTRVTQKKKAMIR